MSTLLAEPFLCAATVLAPAANMLAERLGCDVKFAERCGHRRATIDLSGRGRLHLFTADEFPGDDILAVARRALECQPVPSAAVVIYPDETSRWRSSPRAYLCWRYSAELAGMERSDARLAMDDDSGVLVMAENGEGLVVGGSGHFYASCAYSELDDRWRALLTGSAAWQDRVVKRVWQEAA